MMKTKLFCALATTSLLALGACNNAEMADTDTEEISSSTLATLIGDAENLNMVSDVLGETGLQGLFDGNATYTVLAPTDEVFEAVEVPLDGEDLRAARVAVIREHIVPGFLTQSDIESAISNSDNGSVEIQTMAGHPLTFELDGNAIRVTGENGASAHMLSGEYRGSNGVAIPIDGLLKSFDEPAA